ncbi:MAG: hypothetical protein B6240_12685 [Desulfobacteraceae bacterium 4572_87]|nr:MAG: hypothetical protein B6240_12685 [Desulfobacteraceae bacterium 4572_87]
MTEILVIIAIALAIFMLPRLTGKRVEEGDRRNISLSKMSGWLRLAIMASLLWPAGVAFFLKPWNHHWSIFFYAGMGPVILLWGIFWVFTGFRKGGRNR